MQQVRFKDSSREAARYGNETNCYLFSIDGDYATVKYLDGNDWRPHVVPLVALEVVQPDVVLPVKITDAEILAMWLAAGGTFHGPITETATMTEAKIIDFIRSILQRG